MCDRLILLCNCRFLRGSPFKFKTLASIFFLNKRKNKGEIRKFFILRSVCSASLLDFSLGFEIKSEKG